MCIKTLKPENDTKLSQQLVVLCSYAEIPPMLALKPWIIFIRPFRDNGYPILGERKLLDISSIFDAFSSVKAMSRRNKVHQVTNLNSDSRPITCLVWNRSGEKMRLNGSFDLWLGLHYTIVILYSWFFLFFFKVPLHSIRWHSCYYIQTQCLNFCFYSFSSDDQIKLI